MPMFLRKLLHLQTTYVECTQDCMVSYHLPVVLARYHAHYGDGVALYRIAKGSRQGLVLQEHIYALLDYIDTTISMEHICVTMQVKHERIRKERSCSQLVLWLMHSRYTYSNF